MSQATPDKHRDWSTPFLLPDASHNRDEWALIVLNQPIRVSQFKQLWQASRWHVFADGGANRVYDSLSPAARLQYIPDLIKGDLDSIRADVRAYYAGQSAPVTQDPDQDSTDLMKCISAVIEIETSINHTRAVSQHSQLGIIILGGLSGRIDQTVHTMTQLHKLRKSRLRTFVVTEDSLAWTLDAGTHSIHVDLTAVGPTCGLLPIGIESTILSTKGLKWNLDEKESSFEGMVSTSNKLEGGEVWIKTSNPILWCVEICRRSDDIGLQ